jgi:hypothetical protein
MNPSKFVPLFLILSIVLAACAQATPTQALTTPTAPTFTPQGGAGATPQGGAGATPQRGAGATPLPSAQAGPANSTAAPAYTPSPDATLPPPASPTAPPASGGGPAQATSGLPGMNVLPTWTRPAPTGPARLPAEKWQEWPVIPAVTATFLSTYRKGLALGSDPHAFSKIGDCQSVVAAFLGVYDQPGVYGLPKGQEYLQDTIDWFNGSWSRESQAVRGGFNVASVLSAFLADPAQCKAGETPLDCEFRQHTPSIVLISMETGFEGRTAAVYEKYMRKIIEYALAHGAAPILATKADDFEGDQSINLTTARLAVEYDLPMWNFWLAVQPLPDHGMDSTRNDKFHISVEAWNVRSYTALEVLDAMRKAVNEN